MPPFVVFPTLWKCVTIELGRRHRRFLRMKISTNTKVINFSKRKRIKIKGNKLILGALILIGTLIGLFLALLPNTYMISVEDKEIGTIKDMQVIEQAKEILIHNLKEDYKSNVKLAEDIELKKVRGNKRDEITPEYLITYLRKNANILIEFKELKVDGTRIAILKDESELGALKELLKNEYYQDADVQVDFAKEVTLTSIFAKESMLTKMEELVIKCMETTPKVIEYEVKSGDTLSGIAYNWRTNIASILKENQGMTEQTPLKIGMKLKVRVDEPLLGVKVIKTIDESKED